MDCISDKIVIDFKIDTKKQIDDNLVRTHNYKVIADIEGELTIYVNGKVFLFDQYILLMEFGLELAKWIQNLRIGLNTDFHYESMDDSDGPILDIIMVETDGWQITSRWQEFLANKIFALSIILKAVCNFITNLRIELEQQYKINIDTYL